MGTEAGVSVRSERRGSALWLRLNRPHALNALTAQMAGELHRGLDQAAGGGIRAVVIAGAGRAFCAGADLRQILDQAGTGAGPDAIAGFLQTLAGLFDRVETFTKPVIAAVPALPKTPAGKIDKKALRRQYWPGIQRQIH